jgi:predicted nucleic acid-binding protein
MAAPVPYLLDTNVLLFATRQDSPASAAIERQFSLRASPFRPAICEVTVAELLAFAESWGTARRQKLDEVIAEVLVLPIGRPAIYAEWAKLRSYAKVNGLAIQQDHNDIWIAATAKTAGLTVITSDAAAFLPLRDQRQLAVEVIDPKTGNRLP